MMSIRAGCKHCEIEDTFTEHDDPRFKYATEGREPMAWRDFLLAMALTAGGAMPAAGQTAAPAGPDPGGPKVSIPDFSGIWAHPSLGFEPPLSGPGPVRNKVRKPNGVSNSDMLVGDYTNPILKPEAAALIKKRGEISLSGLAFPDPD